MISSGIPIRWLTAVGMSCLTVLNAAPRLDCLCPDRTCQIACELAFPAAPVADLNCAAERACCCHHKPASAPSDDDSACRSSGCRCQMQVVLESTTPAVCSEGRQPLHLTGWLADFGLLSYLGHAEPHGEPGYVSDLPPDDPVSRAQILRL